MDALFETFGIVGIFIIAVVGIIITIVTIDIVVIVGSGAGITDTFTGQIFVLFGSIKPDLALQVQILRPELPHVGDPKLQQFLPITNLHFQFVINLNSHRIRPEIKGLQHSLIILIKFVAQRPYHGVIIQLEYFLVVPVLLGVGVRLEYDLRFGMRFS